MMTKIIIKNKWLGISLIILFFFFILPKISLAYVDCGLRIKESAGIIGIACEPAGTLTSALRIRKGVTTYGIVLVDPADASASKTRIKTSSGIKALRKYTPGPCGGIASITDARDTNNPTYNTVAIGTQCWLARNLNIGTKIAGASNQANNAVLEKYCYNDTEANCVTDGGLYQWDETMQYVTTEGAQGICPTGWHIPKDDGTTNSTNEWYTLENYLKITGQTCNAARSYGFDCNDAGTKLKSGGTSGFNAPLAGYRVTYGPIFYERGTVAEFWSSTQYSTHAWVRYLNSAYTTTYRDHYSKLNGSSVRCLKD